MLQEFQHTILEMTARGRPTDEVADCICRWAEERAPGVLCSILSVDRTGHLHPLAGPSLPLHYSAALDGLKIGPCVGSCGTAAYRGEPVTVVDISTDPLWTAYKALAEPLGFKACWSSPIFRGNGCVLGTFAFYYGKCRGPSDHEKAIVAACIHLCSILLERDEVRSEIRQLAYFDPLTGLRNRACFNLDFDEQSGKNCALGLLLIDVDHLKRVNDTLGHAAGDTLLREVGLRIAAHAAPGTAYRIGGDEFAILITGESARSDMDQIVNDILTATREPTACGERVVTATVTCGGSTCGSEVPCELAVLRQQADLALYHAKESARAGFVFFDDTFASTITHRFQTFQTVASALAEHRLAEHYQPIVRLDSREIVGLEALCRLSMPDGRILTAGQFVEAVQDLSLGRLITDRMLDEVARDIRHWLNLGIPIQHVGVNVSMADFQGDDLYRRIATVFGRYGVPLQHIILEVTESVYMERGHHDVVSSIDRLRSEGLLVALDDFGTGYASLTHLLSFPVDIIKIDKSFVECLEGREAGRVIVKGLLDIAKGLGMRIVAEGVETTKQALTLQHLGCVLGQGYLFGRPTDLLNTTNSLLKFAQNNDYHLTERSVL
ncbi:bifunctional diguanylate cyclase/phosphodiesterase [Methylobacterium sp.]|uniref:bifunctional diguanylate cyclase/phosphodiesterase n=1 Tax=Methylobacterium sp. TaxID=409 RepID=UPI003C70ACA7